MQANHPIQILPQTQESFLAGLRLYRAHTDNDYTLTDCNLIEVMR